MARRIKLIFLGLLAFTISIVVYTSHIRESYPPDQRTLQDFYHNTKSALDRGGKGSSAKGPAVGSAADGQPVVVDMDNDGDIDKEDARLAQEMANRLKVAEQQAKDLANAKAPNRPDAPSDLIGVGSSASGQKKGAVAAAPAGADAAPAAGAAAPEKAAEPVDEAHAAEVELEQIIKKSPVVIFSKTYCPYSKRAKALLLEKYAIDPAPFVVELDIHPLGAALQSRLAALTDRRTVPNVLINGKSIGGSDDIAALDNNGLLVDKIKSYGGRRVQMHLRLGA